MPEGDETSREWEVAVVGLSGALYESMLVEGDEDTTIHDFKQRLAKKFGTPCLDQRILVGEKPCRPKEKLADCFAVTGKTTVTFVRLSAEARFCKTCGARGLFGSIPKLRRCSGCLDTLYCDNHVCQNTDWPRHKAECFKRKNTTGERNEDQQRSAPNEHLLSAAVPKTDTECRANRCTGVRQTRHNATIGRMQSMYVHAILVWIGLVASPHQPSCSSRLALAYSLTRHGAMLVLLGSLCRAGLLPLLQGRGTRKLPQGIRRGIASPLPGVQGAVASSACACSLRGSSQ